jgi:hypothetical protein
MAVNMLLVALERGPADVRRRLRFARIMIFSTLALLLLAFFAAGLLGLWQAWETADWFRFWLPVFPFAFVFLLLLTLFLIPGVRVPWTILTSVPAGGQELRDAAASGDERLAPLAVIQPAPISPAELPSGQVRVGPLRRLAPTSVNGAVPIALLAFLPLIMILVFIPIFFLILDGTVQSSSSPFFVAFPSLLFLPFVALIIAAIVSARGRRFYVTADEQGLEWPDTSGQSHLRANWSQIRSLSRVNISLYGSAPAYNNAAVWGQRTTYILDAGDTQLLWSVLPFGGTRESGASESLLRLAVARSGRALRDLSTFAAELSRASVSSAPAGSFASLPGVYAVGARQKRPPLRLRYAALGLVPLLLLGALLGTGGWLQSYQASYFQSLPARIHAETPLYHDDLSYQTGDWPTHVADANDYQGFAYADGAYQLSGQGSGKPVSALQWSATYGDAAVEVTATQLGAPPSSGNDGVGVIARSSANNNNFVMLQVNHASRWTLWHYRGAASEPWTNLAGGASTAIHTGPGATNRLLLVVRGQTLLCYVNDQYVGSYDDRYYPLAGSGFVGVYLNESSLTASPASAFTPCKRLLSR